MKKTLPVFFALACAWMPAGAQTTTLDSEQSAFLTLINNYRAQNGVGPLQVSVALQQSSQWMSGDMASKNYFSHTDSLGRDPFTRMAAFGYTYNTYKGENIAAGYSDAQSTFNQWQNACDADSTGACTYAHRKNMLNSSYKVLGIGRAYGASATYRWYWTTDFGGYVDQTLSSGSGSGSTTPPPPPPPSTTPVSIWPSTSYPSYYLTASGSLELGVKFRSDAAGKITGIRFYKISANTGIHTGSLWTSGGQLLGTGTFSNETASGWQTLTFASPVAISANTTYIASYHTNSGVAAVGFELQNSGVNNPPLHALQTGVDGYDGVYIFGAGGVFPSQGTSGYNFWVDVVFVQQ